MTRLTDGQVAELGLAAWRERYPPARLGARARRRLPAGQRGSLFAPATRYCPECLAGDGSAIQESFGGPWLKAWHLPVVFACPAHQRLLEHRCPDAARPSSGSGAGLSCTPARDAGWPGCTPPSAGRYSSRARRQAHPSPLLRARLDQTEPRRQASPGLLALQDKILGLLDPDGPASTVSAGMPASPASYFADLRALGLLACSTWPAARHLSPSEDTAAPSTSTSPRSGSRSRTAGELPPSWPAHPPPLDAAASAGLAYIADRILGGSPDDVREQLRQLLPSSTRKASRTYWARWVTRRQSRAPRACKTAYDPLLRRFTKAGGQPQGRRDAVLVPALGTREHSRPSSPKTGTNATSRRSPM